MTHQTLAEARIHIWVSGRVQGVGFRAYVAQQAQFLGLTGWVRNVGYSEVETVAEGRREILDRFADLIQRGPTASRVDDSRVEWEPFTGEFAAFGIRRSS